MKRTLALFLAMLLLVSVPLALAEDAALALDETALRGAITDFLAADMKKKAEAAEDPWARFLLEQGVSEVSFDLEKFDITAEKPLTVSFLVASGLPDTKSLPEYNAADPAAWLAAMVTAMKTTDTKAKASLMVSDTGGSYTVAYGKNAEAALEKTVKGLAAKAKKGLGDKKILTALKDYLLPLPTLLGKKAPEDMATLESNPAYVAYVARNQLNTEENFFYGCALYGLRNYKLDVSGGPEKVILQYTTPDYMRLMQAAYRVTLRTLAYDTQAKSYSGQELKARYAKELEKAMATYQLSKKQKTDVAETYAFSLLALPETIDPDIFYNATDSFTGDAGTAEYLLITDVIAFPDYPAVPKPKGGRISGDASGGTKCRFQVAKDGYDRCVAMYRASDDKDMGVVFVPSGGKVTVTLPKGKYYFLIGIGDVWYGPEHLFGDGGSYQKTEINDIPSSRYIYTFSMGGIGRGKAVESEDLSYEDMLK